MLLYYLTPASAEPHEFWNEMCFHVYIFEVFFLKHPLHFMSCLEVEGLIHHVFISPPPLFVANSQFDPTNLGDLCYFYFVDVCSVVSSP